MKIVDGNDPAVVALRSQVGVAATVVATTFLAAALALAALALGRLPVAVPPDLMAVLGVAAAVCALIGVVLVGARRGLTVDRRSRVIVSWWGLFGPLHRSSRPLAAVARVTLAKEVVRSGKHRRVVYPVELAGDERLPVVRPRDYQSARRLAERLAVALHLEMVDSSTGADGARPPHPGGEPLRARLRRGGERLEPPAAPAALRSTIRLEPGRVVADIPAPGPALAVVARLAVGVMVAALVLVAGGANVVSWLLARDARLGWVAIAVVTGSILAAVVARLRGLRFTTRVTATVDELTVVACGVVVTIPAAELEELTVAGDDVASLLERRPDGSLTVAPEVLERPELAGRHDRGAPLPTIPPALAGVVGSLAALSGKSLAITARSDRASVTFGAGLPRAEIDYLRAAIIRVVVG